MCLFASLALSLIAATVAGCSGGDGTIETRCGDGVLDPGSEECDTVAVSTCADVGLTAGRVRCTSECVEDFSGCRLEPAVAIDRGGNTTCALLSSGETSCWGSNQYGKAMPPRDGEVVSLDGGCAVREGGSVQCLGGITQTGLGYVRFDGTCGLRADGSLVCLNRPHQNYWLSSSTEWIDMLGLGGSGSLCALNGEGRLACWRDGERLESGQPEGTVFGSLEGASAVATATDLSFCGIVEEEAAVCWRTDGLLSAPDGTFTKVRLMNAGAGCALGTDGLLQCFGEALPSWLAAVDFSAHHFVDMLVDRSWVCGLDTEGGAHCWTSPMQGGLADAPGPEGVLLRSFVRRPDSFYGICGVDTSGAWICWIYADQAARVTRAPDDHGAVTDITVGSSLACRLHEDGHVFCWGDRQPRLPDGSYVQVAASDGALCGLLPSGEVTCANAMPNGSVESAHTDFAAIAGNPSDAGEFCGIRDGGVLTCFGVGMDEVDPLPGEAGFEEIALGPNFHCARRGDDIHCWLSRSNAAVTVPEPETPAEVTGIVVGWDFVCGLTSDGQPKCWGGAPGFEGDETFVELEADRASMCGRTLEGAVHCWGYRRTGNTTFGGITPWSLVDARGLVVADGGLCWLDEEGGAQCGHVPPAAGPFESVGVGSSHACGIGVGGDIDCWAAPGSIDEGQLQSPLGQYRSMAASFSMNCAIAVDGRVECWGAESFGGPVVAPDGTFSAIDVQLPGACGIDTAGALHCWAVHGRTPFDPQGAAGFSGAENGLALGGHFVCGLRDDGTVSCLGDVGAPSVPDDMTFTEIAAGKDLLCGITGDQAAIRCWLAPNDDHRVAIAPQGTGFFEIGVGEKHACARRAQGDVVCWGEVVVGL